MRALLPLALLSAAASLAACSSDDAAPATLARGAFTLTVSSDGRTITLARGADTLLTFPADGFELGVVSALDDALSYDPFWLEYSDDVFVPDPPPSLRFQRVASAKVTKARDAITIEQVYDGGVKATLELAIDQSESRDGARFRARLVPTSPLPIAFMRLRPRASIDEGFYGLGEWPDDVNHRGKLRPMQIEPDLAIESANNENHVPVPLLIGTRGWGLFVESIRAGLFDVARKAPDLVEVTYGTAEASSAGLVFHLFGAAHPLDVTRHYYDVTGDPLLPATWAYGPWIWRNESEDQAEVEDDVRKIRELDLATSAIWIDRPYATKVNSFDWDPARYTDPAAMITAAHDAGLRVALWHTPYLEEGTEPLLGEAEARGFFPLETGPLLNRWGEPIDLTNPDAFAWWQSLIERYTSMGIEGFKLDYAEDIVTGIGGARTPWRFADGSDERTMHHGYTVLYHRAYAEKLPASGGFLLCRAGRWGDQRNVSVIWPGDLDATLTRHREVFTSRGGDEVLGVGGLPAAIVMGLSLGPSGFPFYGSDTGGYRHSPPDEETFVRWTQHTALSSVMQVGDGSSQPPWVYTPENGRSDHTLALYRDLARLHLRLFPYAWAHAKRLAIDGRPLMRPFGLQFPELGVHPNDQYMFGDDLLVAPVVAAGATKKTVVFPAGEWVDFFTGDQFVANSGGNSVEVDAPLEKLPLYLRAGAVIPMLRPTIDTLSPVAASRADEIESWANDPGPLWLRTTPGPATTFVVDDGTKLETAPGSMTITEGSLYRSGYVIEVIATSAPARVTIDGTALDAAMWSHDAAVGGTLTIEVPAGSHVVAWQ
ncbi:hypothetical protein L6R52_26220 [Myxococcota bacterium]|nr:hypothetical protein [Myxococcota bacterium]